MTHQLKKIGYLDFTTKVEINLPNFCGNGDKLLYCWWGAIAVEATLFELEDLHRKVNFKIVDNLSDTLYIIALLHDPLNWISNRAIGAGPAPCVASDAEITELDLPWFHLLMNAEERDRTMKILSTFQDHKVYILASVNTLECFEVMTSEKLKQREAI